MIPHNALRNIAPARLKSAPMIPIAWLSFKSVRISVVEVKDVGLSVLQVEITML
jgi:hypothetical protein